MMLHFMTTFRGFTLKIETGSVTKVVEPALKTRNINDNC